MTDRACRKWFVEFHAGDFSLNDALRLHRPAEVGSDQIEILLDSDQCSTTRKRADVLKTPKSSVESHVHQLGYVNHCNVWVPHKQKKAFLTLLPHVILYLNTMTTFHF